MKAAAKFLSVTEEDINTWIDQHYVPTLFAKAIARKLGYMDITDLQWPTTGYDDPKTGFHWPVSWWHYCVESDAEEIFGKSGRNRVSN